MSESEKARRRESEWVDFRLSTFDFLYFLFILTPDSLCLCVSVARGF